MYRFVEITSHLKVCYETVGSATRCLKNRSHTNSRRHQASVILAVCQSGITYYQSCHNSSDKTYSLV